MRDLRTPKMHPPRNRLVRRFLAVIRAVADSAVIDDSRAEAPPPAYDEGAVATSDETITLHAQTESRMSGNLVVNLAIADIDKNPFQTRHVDDDDKLEELSNSIQANGVVQPIMVRPGDEDGRYILVLGERRLLASKKAGKTTIPALVRRVSAAASGRDDDHRKTCSART